MPRTCLLFLLLLHLALSAQAQQRYYKTFNADQGLPGSEVLQLLEDQQGFLWLCTDQGLVRYDGLQFEPYGKAQGLPDPAIVGLYESPQGQLWAWGLQGSLAKYQPKLRRWQAHPSNEALNNLLNGLAIRALCSDGLGNLWISVSGQNQIYRLDAKTDSLHSYPLDDEDFQGLLYLGPKRYLPLGPNWLSQIDLEQAQAWEKQTFGPQLQGFLLPYTERCQALSNGKWLCHQGLSLLERDSQGNILQIGQLPQEAGQIRRLYQDAQGDFWLATRRGLWHYPQGNLKAKPHCLFPEKSILNVFQDSENNQWIATEGEGLLFLSPLLVEIFPLETPDIHAQRMLRLLERNGQLWALNQKGDLYLWDGEKLRCAYLESDANWGQSVYDAIWLNTKLLYRSDGLIWDAETQQITTYDAAEEGLASLCLSAQGNWQAMGYDYGLFLKREGDPNWFNPGVEGRVEALAWRNPQTLILGTQRGAFLYHLDQDRLLPFLSKEQHRILSLQQFGNHTLVGTAGAGLLIAKGDSLLSRQGHAEGLAGDFVHGLYVESDSVLWVGGNQGLARILHWQQTQPHIERYDYASGLPHNLVYDLRRVGPWLWVASERGLFRLQLPQNSSLKPKPAFIHSLRINGQLRPMDLALQLSAHENNLEFEYGAVRLRSAQNLAFEHFLEGQDSTWQYSRQRSIQYTRLPPGKYRFRLRIAGEDTETQFEFEIQPQFWNRWSFRLGLLLLLGLGLWYYLRAWRLRNRMALQQAQAEQYALRSQMNPHFLFNALNSILFFIHQNDRKGAMQYLQKFARLLRRSLESTRQEFLPLEDELKNVKDYLDLEAQRLAGSGLQQDFALLHAEDPRVKAYKIPPMMLQPLLENAIVHGLAPKQQGLQQLRLSLHFEEAGLRIDIEDNGLGLAAAQARQAQQSNKKTGFGLENTRKRIAVINYLHKTNLSLKLESLDDEKGQVLGTRASLFLPLLAV